MLKTPVLVILRGIKIEHIAPIAKCLVGAKIDTVEITMNTENAAELITEMKKQFPEKLSVGAGTVLTLTDLDEALSAGAEFIVTPVINPDVLKACKEKSIPFYPGAYTPTEVWTECQYCAEMVKVFPADLGGPKYFKTLKGPLNKIKLMAVNGVNVSNISEYFENGADAVAIGGSIFSKERLDSGNYSAITEDLKEIVSKIV